ncbi:hypothetical protein [Streptomyces sp. NBC_01614]|uniref:hypothetical protein n=1 Tax=Streptomyces sp. NBC_01614 TaxID=2975897 RepID=UPI0038663523
MDPDLGRYLVAAGWFCHGVRDFVHLRLDKVVSRTSAEWCGVIDVLVAVQLLFLVQPKRAPRVAGNGRETPGQTRNRDSPRTLPPVVSPVRHSNSAPWELSWTPKTPQPHSASARSRAADSSRPPQPPPQPSPVLPFPL